MRPLILPAAATGGVATEKFEVVGQERIVELFVGKAGMEIPVVAGWPGAAESDEPPPPPPPPPQAAMNIGAKPITNRQVFF